MVTSFKQVGLHILFWGVILYWRAQGDYYWDIPIEKFYLNNLVRLPILMISTYIVLYYLLPKYIIDDKQYLKFGLLFLLNLAIATALEKLLNRSDFMHEVLQPISHKQWLGLKTGHPFRNSFSLLSIMGLASVIRFFKLFREKEQKENQLKEENLTTKLAFLKSQVNPHFLFNALNNIYSMAVQKNQPEIAEGLENLSGIMHYLTYESSSSFVPLEKEIELLKNYIEIQHLRIANTDDTTISFNMEGDFYNKTIAPVILLPLVENAFKHGIKPDQKCIVSIKLTIKEDQLIFKTTNTIFDKSDREIKEKGIGIENVRKRLHLLYPNNHFFRTTQIDNTYFCDLDLSLGKIEN